MSMQTMTLSQRFGLVHAMLTLQTQGEAAGGAGSRRIEWEFDDAVFKEAA